jgi:glycosyltransferase involved in cell wall biosynthesis
MRVLLVHNRYVLRGGEDTVFDQERQLLIDHGHDVAVYTLENQSIDGASRLALGAQAIWSSKTTAAVAALVRTHGSQVVHVHNTLPLISPSVFHAASGAGVPVVKTLHNYRMLCANGMLIRDGAICEDCVGQRVAWSAIRHGCYRNDRAATAVVVSTIALHRAIGTYRRKIARYIALCEFSRNKLLQAGLPAERVVIKPNFATDRYEGANLDGPRDGALWLGRLSPEKGVRVLLEAWRRVARIPLAVIGTGPMEDELKGALQGADVRLLGYVDDHVRTRELSGASFVVMPSLVYEGFPMVVAEAFSAGTPIIASRLGAMAELVEDGVTGLHFEPGNSEDLAAKVLWAREHPDEMRRMGRAARRVYERLYTAAASHRRLVEIYEDAIASRATLS